MAAKKENDLKKKEMEEAKEKFKCSERSERGKKNSENE